MNNIINALRMIKPPKNAVIDEAMLEEAARVCPAIDSLPASGSFAAGVKAALTKAYIPLSGVGADHIMLRIDAAYLEKVESQVKAGSANLAGLFDAMPSLKEVTNLKDAFGAGILIGMTSVYLAATEEAPIAEDSVAEEKEIDEGDEVPQEEEGEEEEVIPVPPAPAEGTHTGLGAALLALHSLGLDASTVSMAPVFTKNDKVWIRLSVMWDVISVSGVAELNKTLTKAGAKELVLRAESVDGAMKIMSVSDIEI